MPQDTTTFEAAHEALAPASNKLTLRRVGATIAAAAGGAYGLGAVVSYSPLDPSLNVATDADPTNLFGAPGAVFADLAIQSVGAAAPAALTALLAAGAIRIARKRAASPISPARLMSGAAGVALLAGLVSYVPTPGAWLLGSGFGGVIGDVVAGATSGLYTVAGLPLPDVWSGLSLAALSALSFGFAFRVKKEEAMAAANAAGRAAIRAGASAQTMLANLAERSRQRAALVPPETDADADDAYALTDGSAAPHYAPTPVAPAPRVTAPRLTPMPADMEPMRPAAPAAAPQPAPMAAQPAARKPRAAAGAGAQQGELSFMRQRQFRLPPLDLLSPPRPRAAQADGAALKAASQRLAATLVDFGVQGEIVAARPGPVVTLFELEPAPGVKSARVVSLADDIARSMSANAARVAVIPGRNAIGIELPNPKRETVFLRSLMASNAFVGSQGGLPLALGETIEGEPFAADLAKMPHLLIAGTTGSGKSVGINAMILSLLYRLTPEQCRFIMIDPKMLELSVYEGIPHLLAPVVTDPKKAVVALKWTVREMEERYRRMAKLGVRNIQGYNDRIAEAAASGEPIERSVHTGFDADGEPIIETEALALEPMPYIVVVIDEMADLMLTAGKEIEAAVQRLAQMARAAGIHVIMATQRPSVDVITGTIKANFPTRISYSVTSKIDSRTILGEQGAEQLLGMGDLLFMAGGGKIRRLHGPFVSDTEVERVVATLKAQGQPSYRADILEDPDAPREEDDEALYESMPEASGDDLFDRAVQIVLRDRKASTSYLQRRLQVGYNRAASLIERMEKEGIISNANHAGKREILSPPVAD
ncbi:MAG: DNA translocase FtsK 4TM domain-containing protein [Alphaproteobacteria bacterium]|nr:DNA translocase FtsK 4TM domain-containing protein [Alphaproteobacteria bacterium]